MTDAATKRMTEHQLIALGILLASPKLLATMKPSDFADAEIGGLVNSLLTWTVGGKATAEAWFAQRGIDMADGIASGLLAAVALDAKYKRGLEYVTAMALGGRLKGRDEWIRDISEHKWE